MYHVFLELGWLWFFTASCFFIAFLNMCFFITFLFVIYTSSAFHERFALGTIALLNMCYRVFPQKSYLRIGRLSLVIRIILSLLHLVPKSGNYLWVQQMSSDELLGRNACSFTLLLFLLIPTRWRCIKPYAIKAHRRFFLIFLASLKRRCSVSTSGIKIGLVPSVFHL